jgi:hypothetical protein
VWHGDENPVVPYTDSVRDFQNHPSTMLHIVPGMGLYPDVSVFDSIFSWLAGRPHAALRSSDGGASSSADKDPVV